MKRVYLYDNLKFLAMLCILVLHSTIPYAHDGMTLMKYMQPFINLYPMTLFTIISGYWYKKKSFRALLLQFLWPCILFTVINGILGNFFYPNYWNIFKFKPGYAMWYLMALFLYSILTKIIRQRWGAIKYLLIAFCGAFIIGCIPISNNYFEIQRISCLFPCFAFGVMLKEYAGNQLLVDKIGGGKVHNIRLLSIIILALIVVIQIAIIYFYPERTGAFKAYYGFNIIAALEKWGLMFLRVIACVCIIVLMPNEEYWFTKYGSRTMNVYLLHVIPIFVICWGLLYDFRYEWYGLATLFVGVPLLCTLFFSARVDRIMKKVLLFDVIKKIRQ